MLGPLILMILLCDAGSACPTENNLLTLDPPEVIGEYGDTVLVNCTSTHEDHHGMYWRQTSKPDSDMEEDYNFITLSISLSDWNTSAECKIKLSSSQECSKHLKITVYKNPDMVKIFPITYRENAVPEGTQYALQCDVINVAPIQNLTVTWYKDDQAISTHSFTNSTKKAGNESSSLIFNISREENGAQFKCEAKLDFGRHGSQPPETSKTHQISVHYAPELKNKTDIHISVNEGNDVTLNCEAEGNPPPAFHWTCDGVNIMENRDNFNIAQVNTSTTYNCTATNDLGSITKQIHVHVIKTTRTTAPAAMTPPAATSLRSCPLTLSPSEIVVRFGDPVSLKCDTSATDAVLMGWEAAVGHAGLTNPPSVTWIVEKLEEWTFEPKCYVTLKDDLQCYVMPAITIYKTPDILSISETHHGPMMEGTEYRLNCSVINVAPVQKLKVKWYRGNETILTESFNNTNVVPVNVSSTLSVTPKKNDNAALFRCEAELHLGPNGPELVPTAASSPYTADVLYKPELKCPGHYTGVEREFSLGMVPCQADGNPVPTVQWYYQGNPINASEPLTRTHSGKYTADVVNQLGRSNTTVNITIEYGPSFTCNDRYEVVKDGKLPSMCEPEGIPKPIFTWFKDGKEMASPQRWTQHDSGNYLLEATNKHGTAKHTLRVDVLYAPVFNEGNYSKQVTPGENVTFQCLAEGNPTPDTYWNYTSAVNVRATTGRRQTDISIPGATSTNAGVYICVASNRVGLVTRSVTLVVKDETTAGQSPLIWRLLILLVVIVIVILTVIILYLHRKKKKKGEYTFVHSIPMATQSDSLHA